MYFYSFLLVCIATVIVFIRCVLKIKNYLQRSNHLYFLLELPSCNLTFLEKPCDELLLKIQKKKGWKEKGKTRTLEDSFWPFHKFFQSQLISLYMLGLYLLILNLPVVILHIKNFRIMCEWLSFYDGVLLLNCVPLKILFIYFYLRLCWVFAAAISISLVALCRPSL